MVKWLILFALLKSLFWVAWTRCSKGLSTESILLDSEAVARGAVYLQTSHLLEAHSFAISISASPNRKNRNHIL